MQAVQQNHQGSSAGIIYHCRMQFLKSREGRSQAPKKQRRKSSLDLFVGNDTPQFFNGCTLASFDPCSDKILLPPNELMTRPKAFKHAYWKHHCKPTVCAIEKLEIHQIDERKERLHKKRKEILAKIRKHEAKKRETELRRRAERVLSRHSSDFESEEASEEDESESELEGQLGMMSFSSPSRDSACSTSQGHKKIMSQHGRRGRRTMFGSPVQKDALHGGEEASDSFAFLSDWSSPKNQKIRW